MVGNTFDNFETYVDLQSTGGGGDFTITHTQIHSYPEKTGIKEAVLVIGEMGQNLGCCQCDTFFAFPLETSARLHSAKLPSSEK